VRTETFEEVLPDASYIGLGADPFKGILQANSGKFNPYNVGGTLISYDVTKDFLINGTVRYEDYSDFGVLQFGK
jgi:iron complex outermembrane receptor protein